MKSWLHWDADVKIMYYFLMYKWHVETDIGDRKWSPPILQIELVYFMSEVMIYSKWKS